MDIPSLFRLKLIIAGTLVLAAYPVFAEPETIAERKRAFDRQRVSIGQQFFESGRTEYLRSIRVAFSELFLSNISVSEVESIPEEDLEIWFSSYRSFAWTTSDAKASLTMVALLEEMYSRGAAFDRLRSEGPAPAQKAYDSLVNARLFILAERLANRYPEEIKSLPDTIGSIEPLPNSAPFYSVGDDGLLSANSLNINDGEWLIASVHPGCSFSLEAMRYFEQHSKELEPHLPPNIAWISTQRYTYTLPWLEKLNREAEVVNILVSADDNRWPERMALHVTPAFYRVKDGKVVERSLGWMGDDAPASFKEFLKGFQGD